jgi:hypothetical protein
MTTYRFKGKKVTLEELTAALRQMPDGELLNFTEAIERSTKQADVAIRNAAQAEWKRRHTPSVK